MLNDRVVYKEKPS